MNLILSISTINLLLSMMSYSIKSKHLLTTLLILEFMILNLFLMISIILMPIANESMFLLVFLTMSACEGALGLSLLVKMVRLTGSDYLSSLNTLQC